MIAGDVLRFALTCLLLIVVPGPSVLFIVGRALSDGLRVALATVLGNSLGCLVVGALVATVLGALLHQLPVIAIVLRFAGAAVLVVLGVRGILAARHTMTAPEEPRITSSGTAFRAAVVVGATNPKTFIVFGVLLPSFLPAGHVSWMSALALVPVPIVIGLVCDTVWAAAASSAAAWFRRSPRGARALEIIGGVLLIGLGVLTATLP
jgi:threonine/homoserine/homoserine lactone efflux protein